MEHYWLRSPLARKQTDQTTAEQDEASGLGNDSDNLLRSIEIRIVLVQRCVGCYAMKVHARETIVGLLLRLRQSELRTRRQRSVVVKVVPDCNVLIRPLVR